MHRLLALRARLRRSAGHVRADHRRARLCLARSARGRRATISCRQRMRLAAAPACRPARPRPCRKRRSRRSASPSARWSPPAPIAGSAAPSAPRCGASSWCAWCRGRTARPIAATPASRAASPGAMPITRTASPAPMIRESIDQPWREVSWDEALAFTAGRLQRDQGATRRAGAGRDHLQPLHQRGDLPRPEAGPRRVRLEQCRYLRAGLPFADRLWPEDHLRDQRGHAGFRQRDGCRRHPGDRRQPDRRAPGLRQPDEAAAAAGREADRHRPAPDRSGAHARMSRRRITCRCSPAPMSRC